MSVKRDAMPGGAPMPHDGKRKLKRLQSSSKKRRRRRRAPEREERDDAPPRRKRSKKAKAPCKYGERGADGKCPKKPKAPCKYGQRGPDGKCPKAPKRKTKRQVTQERIRKAFSPSTPATERKEAAKLLAYSAGAEVGKSVARGARAQIRSKRGRQQLRQAAAAVGGAALRLAKRAGPVAAFTAGVALRQKEIATVAEQRVREVEKRTGPLPPNARATLLKQHREFARKQLAIRPSKSR